MRYIFIHFILGLTLAFANIITIDTQITQQPHYKSLVAIGPGALRLVTYMNLQDKLIGIEKIEQQAISFSEYRTVLGKDKIFSLPLIGSGGPGKLPNLEMLIKLKPDVIVASFVDKNQLDLIVQKANIPIILLSYGSGYGGKIDKMQAIKKSLVLLGKTFNKEKRAQELVAFMNAQEKELQSYQIPNKILYAGGMGFKGAHGITSTEKDYPPFKILGITNPLTQESKSNHLFIQEESLIAQDPDIIFIDSLGKKIVKENFETKKVLYSSLKAYKNENIYYLLGYNFYNANIANIYIDSWIILQKLGYKIDIKAKMEEIYNAFYPNEAQKLLPSRFPLMKFQ